MRKDRNELHDLSRSMPQKAAELKKLYEAWAHRWVPNRGTKSASSGKRIRRKSKAGKATAQFNDREDGAVIGRHSFG